MSQEDRQKRLAAYVSAYQHHALRKAAFDMHPRLVNGLNASDKLQRDAGLRHSWFMVPLLLGVETSLEKSRDYIAAIAHERHSVGDFTVHVLSMPKPERSTEAAFVAIAWHNGEPPSYPNRSPTARYFTLEMMKDQSFTFCEWKQDKHLNYGQADSDPARFVQLVTEKLGGGGSLPVATFDETHGVQLGPAATAPKPNETAANSQPLVGAMEDYQKEYDVKVAAIMAWLAPRFKEKPEVAKVLDSVLLKFVQDRFGPASQQALDRIAQHVKQFPSNPVLRELLAREMFSRIQISLPISELKREIEQQVPEWEPFIHGQADVLGNYLQLLSLLEEKRIKLEVAKLAFPVQGTA